MNIDMIKRALLFAKYQLWRKDAISSYKNMLYNQHLSTDELNHINLNKAKTILAYAYEKVPFYQRKFSAIGLHPNDIATREDYNLVPLLTKEELRSSFSEFISEDATPKLLRECATGGSTGIPVKVMVDRRVPQESRVWQVMNWWGLSPGVNSAFIWRLTRKRKIDRVLYNMAHWPTKKIFLDASCMTADTIEDFIGKFNRIRPQLLQGYVGAIYHLALHVEENGLSVHSPKAIWVTSSPVTMGQRRRIENVFKGPVYDQYGCGEVSWLAAECRRQAGLHMFHDTRLIEFVDECGHARPTGEIGRVVITNLDNFLFPIIRYENGDMGRALPGTCPCGLNLPLMDSVTGRTTDLIRLPRGQCISGDYLTTVFDDYPGAVKAFQIKQQSDYSICLMYVPDLDEKELSPVLKKVKHELSNKTMSQVPIHFQAVEVIPHDRGKLRFVTSEVL